MNMFEQPNACCRRLWHDESGVVLAFTVIVFLSLFVIACSVYGVGENIRQRIELQNAADAAAYSGAVVQADALSRVAAINKAMVWTYVQMGRAEMDYAVDKWLQEILTKWKYDYGQHLRELQQYPSGHCSSIMLLSSWIGQQSVGTYPVSEFAGEIRINNNKSYRFPELMQIWAGNPYHWPALQIKIIGYRKMIQGMNTEEARITGDLEEHIRKTVIGVLKQNVGHPEPQAYWYSVSASAAAGSFKTLNDENIALQFFDSGPKNAMDAFADGIDVWFKDMHPNDGIQRDYEQQASSLLAEWRWHLEFWSPKPPHGVCTRDFFIDNGREVRGSDVISDLKTEKIQPQILTPSYFEPRSKILVAVARQASNPLAFMMADTAKPGLFGFFNPDASDGKPNYAWAVATSRAGYRKDGGGEGEYWTTDEDGQWQKSPKNLSQWDWDAALIPLKKPGGLGQVLQSLWDGGDSKWLQLYGSEQRNGLGTFAAGPAPTAKPLH